MNFTLEPDPIPIRFDEHGVARIGNTRLTLETVIWHFKQGETPERIVQQYPVLTLPTLYAVIAYYLNHREELDEYLREQAEWSEAVRREGRERFGQSGLREKLLARLEEKRQRP